ncbi:MAG: GlsB/YeaQ/YmgE family stress response membrane protein [Planctomycetaceae bacterium]
MFSFIWWLVVGIIAGALARFFVPGRQSMGLFMTMILGLIGSVIGGFISSLIFGYDPTDPGFHTGGIIMSTIGAIIALAIYIRMSVRHA